jgi:penicillin-insensitive murein endopeptidase
MIFRLFILSSLVWLSACSNYDPELVARLSTKEAKHLFGAVERGSEQRPAPHGSYAKGCVAGRRTVGGNRPDMAGNAAVA